MKFPVGDISSIVVESNVRGYSINKYDCVCVERFTMTSRSLTLEQEAKLTKVLEIARLLEQQSKAMSERATDIADKYYRERHEAAIAAQQGGRDA
jgi:hypothetical protein